MSITKSMKINNIIGYTNQYTYLTICLLLVIGFFILFILLSNAVGAFDPNATKYELVNKWGSKGTGNGQFNRPHDLDFSNDEKFLYSVDRDGNRIQVFDKNGTFLFKWGILGTGDGQMH